MSGFKFLQLHRCVIAFISILSFTQVQAQRQVMSLNESWLFTTQETVPGRTVDSSGWKKIQLPHTWNVADVMDDEPGYYRGAGWYKKTLYLSDSFQSKQLFLFFEGAGQQTEVYVNGKKAGAHTGGYTAFYVPLNGLLKFDGDANKNELLIRVDNSFSADIPPLDADFTFYGGIYRDLFLVATDAAHFSTTDYGSPGIFITTPEVSAQRAKVLIGGTITNDASSKKIVRVSSVIYDAAGGKVTETTTRLTLSPKAGSKFNQSFSPVTNPHLWSPDDPYLYTIETRILDDKTNTILDESRQPLGFRWYRFDAATGFYLNDQPLKLIGVSRHQDYKDMGNAMPDALARRDMEAIKQMGGNFLRVAHYPQDPSILEACDRLGIIASVEIPVVNEITESPGFTANCEQMLIEMIRQNFNHPCVVIWCYMNEVLLRPHFNNDKQKQLAYFGKVAELAASLDSIARKEDPSRYTMIANHGDFDRYNSAGITKIPMIVGWNLYSGWYGGTLADFPKFLDKHHQLLPKKPVMVTEYGADADPRIHSFEPVRFDKSIEYALNFHQYYLDAIRKRPFVAGAMAWNLADFNSETREETMPHINNKGLLTWDRKPKDTYHFYEAALRKDPVIKISSGIWTIRGGIADSASGHAIQQVTVTTNLEAVELFINGQTLGSKKVDGFLASWQVPFVNGINKLEARGSRNGTLYNDILDVDFALQPFYGNDKNFREVNLLLGAKRFYVDEEKKQLWQSATPYHKGGWGFTGGTPFRLRGNARLSYGSDKNIIGSDNDPIYQTQQVGIKEFAFDVAPGKYELVLHFAELAGASARALAYNLSAGTTANDSTVRVFDVWVNDRLAIDHLNLAAQYGTATAVERKILVDVTDNKGVRVIFKSVSGEPVLNAIQLRKIY